MSKYDLPEGWVETTLGDLLREPLRNGHSARASSDGTGVRTLTLSAVTYGDFSPHNTKPTVADPLKVADLWLEPGDLLIERSNTPELVGTARLYSGRRNFAIFPDLVIRARLAPVALPRLIEMTLHLDDTRTYFIENAQGTAGSMPKIDQGVVLGVPICLPPYAEQRRIVEKAESLLAHVSPIRDRLKKASAFLKRFRHAVLAAACSGRLSESWRKTNQARRAATSLGTVPEPDEVVSTDGLDPLPPTWAWAPLGSYLENIEAGKSFACRERPPTRAEIGVAKVSAVTWGEYQETESKTCTDPEKIDRALLIRQGDFLFSRANTIELVGACVIAKNVRLKIMLSDKILRLRLRGISPYWVLSVLRSRHGRNEIERLATGNQQSMRNIGQDRIRQIRIPVPPKAEIAEIASRTEALFKLAGAIEQRVATAIQHTDKLTQAIFRQALRGELVPIEAELARAEGHDYEPASVLLERIRRDRDAVSYKKNAWRGGVNSSPRRRRPLEVEGLPGGSGRRERVRRRGTSIQS